MEGDYGGLDVLEGGPEVGYGGLLALDNGEEARGCGGEGSRLRSLLEDRLFKKSEAVL